VHQGRLQHADNTDTPSHIEPAAGKAGLFALFWRIVIVKLSDSRIVIFKARLPKQRKYKDNLPDKYFHLTDPEESTWKSLVTEILN